MKVNLGNKFTNWTISRRDKSFSYSSVLSRTEDPSGFIQKIMGTKPDKFGLHSSTKSSLTPIISDGEDNFVYMKYGIYQTGVTLVNTRPNFERLSDLLHTGYSNGSQFFTGMVDSVTREYQEIVVNGSLYYQNSEVEGPYLITKGIRDRFAGAFITDQALWFRQKYDFSQNTLNPYVLPPGDKFIRYIKIQSDHIGKVK